MKVILTFFSLWIMSCSIAYACNAKEHRQFDFWVGQWKVFTKEGKFAGENNITLSMNNCVLKESYKTPKGYFGESLNIYDKARKVWHQTWVDNGGLLLSLEGHWDGKKMSMQGNGFDVKRQSVIHRIQWTPQENGDVHQHWETSKDNGQSWNNAFYGIYKKQ